MPLRAYLLTIAVFCNEVMGKSRITGHKTPGIGRKYEHVPISKKFDAISKLPVIPLQVA